MERVVFTKADLADIPEHQRAEIIEGDLVMIPAPNASHQMLMLRIARALQDHVEPVERVLVAPFDVEFDDYNVLQPDVLVLPEGTKPQLHPWQPPQPIWVAEIISPSTAKRDRGVKLRIYQRFGISEAWIVDQFERNLGAREW